MDLMTEFGELGDVGAGAATSTENSNFHGEYSVLLRAGGSTVGSFQDSQCPLTPASWNS
ncbi:hypothetical protein [Streptosporangium nondiastaticum]|uniref:hypothetical protein n=1 Tax=Streptosporangium nondiastaticum TaxID=35764 RepID=UPI00167BC782|nr:hypothetical protein [Streptosporangium nondiastaticum]